MVIAELVWDHVIAFEGLEVGFSLFPAGLQRWRGSEASLSSVSASMLPRS